MILFIVLIDEHVLWWEALIMIVAYFGYIALMAVNSRIERWALGAMKTIKKRVYPSMGGTESSSGGISLKPNESTPLHMASKATQATVESAISPVASVSASTQTICREDSVDAPDPKAAPNGHMDVAEDEDVDDPGYPWDPPDGVLAKIWWLCFFPLNLLYFFTIPDVRRAKCVNFYPLAFVMCMVWIGVIAYEVTWLITVIGKITILGYLWSFLASKIGQKNGSKLDDARVVFFYQKILFVYFFDSIIGYFLISKSGYRVYHKRAGHGDGVVVLGRGHIDTRGFLFTYRRKTGTICF